MVSRKSANEVSSDISDVAKELAMLDADPTAEIIEEPAKPKKTAAKKTTTVKKAAETAKKASETAKKATETAKTTAKKATTAAKNTVKKAASKKEVSKHAIVEFAGNQYSVEEILVRCEEKYKSENKKKTYDEIRVYIKPENNAAYYVVDDKSAGMVNLI